MPKNEYLVAKIGLDTAENEPSEKCAFGCCYNNLRPTLHVFSGWDHLLGLHRATLNPGELGQPRLKGASVQAGAGQAARQPRAAGRYPMLG